MDKIKRRKGKLIRLIAKLDRAWRMAGEQQGRLKNRLAFELGNAYRAGVGTKARQVQRRNAVTI